MQVKVKDEFVPVKFKDIYTAVETELQKWTETRGQLQVLAALHPGK
jgi:hypothetical protein